MALACLFALCDAVLQGQDAAKEEELRRKAEELLRETYKKKWTHDRRKRALTPEEREVTPAGFKVQEAVPLRNGELLSRYDACKARVQARVQAISGGTRQHVPLTADWAPQLAGSHNEWLLMHGTSDEKAQAIVASGFNLQHALDNGACGKAFYFAESSTKADEYSSPVQKGALRVLLLCKVLGGVVEYTEERCPDKKRLTALLQDGSAHSVLNNREVPSRTFKEYAVANPDHILPVCLIRYRQE